MTITQIVRQVNGEAMTGLYCKECGTLLGYTSPHNLVLGAVLFTGSTQVCCLACKRQFTWRSTPKQEKPSETTMTATRRKARKGSRAVKVR